MAAARQEFADAGVSILIVSQAKPAIAALFLRHFPQPVSLVCDPERRLYRLLGLERTHWWNFLRPTVLFGYLGHIRRGMRILKPYEGEDVYQLGGDFLFDRAGRIVYAYRSQDATDRPTVREILQSLGTG